MTIVHLVVRFVLELAALAALGYWGFHEHDGIAAVVLGVGGPVAAAVLWQIFVSPKRRVRRGMALRWFVELLVFAAATAALIAAGAVTLGIVFGVAAGLSSVLDRVLGQPEVLDSRA